MRGRKSKPKGAPRKYLTPKEWATIERMAQAQCSVNEMADYLGISARTFYAAHLRDRFLRVTKQKAAAAKLAVRERQLKQALTDRSALWCIQWGNVHMGQSPKYAAVAVTSGPLDAIAGVGVKLDEILTRLAPAQATAQSGPPTPGSA